MPGRGALVTRLSHALALLQRTPPRRISTPRPHPPPAHSVSPRPAPTVRRASVAILLRIRPTLEDEQWLAEQYGADGQPLPGTEVAPMMQQLYQPSPVSTYLHDKPTTDVAGSGHAATPPTALPDSYVGAPIPHILRTFFTFPWVRRGTPEIFFIKRATRPGDNWSAQVAFPGGRREDADENGLHTAVRETWEETGIDLAEKKGFVCLGQLDDREITYNLGQNLLMILSPYVFLQTSPFSPHPSLAASEVASSHWIPLSLLDSPAPETCNTLTVDVTNRLAPRSSLFRWLLRTLVGDMEYRSIFLPNQPVAEAIEKDVDVGESESHSSVTSSGDRDDVSYEDNQIEPKANDSPDYPVDALSHPHITPHADSASSSHKILQKDRPPLQLWGLTLGMTMDLLSIMPSSDPVAATSLSTQSSAHRNAASRSQSWVSEMVRIHRPGASWRRAPIFAAAFPRFTYPDVNMWIWVFGFHYRRLAAEWAKQIAKADHEAKHAWEALGSQEVPTSSRPRPGGQPRRDGQRIGPEELARCAYYAAVRRALLVTAVLRGVGAVFVAAAGIGLLLRS